MRVTVGLLRKADPNNENVVFWRDRLIAFSGPTRQHSESLLLNQMVPIYFERVAESQFQSLRALHTEIANRYGVFALTLLPLNLSDSYPAAGHLHQVLETLDEITTTNHKRLKRLWKRNMHYLSPWSESVRIEYRDKRMFCYCANKSQPLFRKIRTTTRNTGRLLTKFPVCESNGCCCTFVRISKEVPALFCETEIHFRIVLPTRTIVIDDLKRVLPRTRFHTHFCLELFRVQKRSLLLDFGESKPSHDLKI